MCCVPTTKGSKKVEKLLQKRLAFLLSTTIEDYSTLQAWAFTTGLAC
jgi:hypothetical protein